MALITCPECGKQISDKADICIGCGYPIAKISSNSVSETDKLVDEVWKKHPYSKTDAVRELQNRGIKLKAAKMLMDAKFDSEQAKQVIKQKKQLDKKEKEERKLQQKREMFYDNMNKVAKCPRCKSLSISYEKKLSLGRALVGDAIAGAPGAILGGLSSKKGYAVCLNCGKRWKI